MRRHFFDNGKAFASILGFFYHVGLVFSIPWIINTDSKDFDKTIYLFTQCLSLFRMPLFMFISGYFAIYSVRKYNFASFASNKFFRLGLPLLSTLFTFVFIQHLYSDILFKGISTISDVVNKVVPWSNTFDLAHLWFLYLILVYSFLLYLFDRVYRRNRYHFKQLKLKLAELNYFSIDILFIALSFGSSLFFLLVSKASPINHALLPFTDFGYFLSYFTMGILTFIFWDKYSKPFFDFSKKRLMISLIILFLAMIPIYLINHTETMPFTVLSLLFTMIAKYYSLLVTLHILYRYFNKTNKYIRYLADSSYSIYLLHHPIIVIVSFYYLKYMDGSNLVSYLTILAVSIFITYSLDFLIIRKTRVGKFLFTGVKSSSTPHSIVKVETK